MRERFLTYLTTEKRASAHTLDAYNTDLKQFEMFVSEIYDLEGIQSATSNMIRSWVVQLKDHGISARSINRKLTSLRSYYGFLQKTNPGTDNPAAKINSLKSKKQLPVFIPQESMQKLLEDEGSGLGFSELRDYLIIEVLYQTGMRRAELVQLKEKDIDFGRSVFKVSGKRNKQRFVPFHSKLSLALNAYLEAKHNKYGTAVPALIVSDKGRPATADLIYRIVNSYLKQFTSLTKTSPHVLRHTFATHLLNNGASLIAIRDLLGHSNLAATEIYTHNSIEQLKKIHEQAHPKGH